MAVESDFQSDLKDELEAMFPGAYVLKNDPKFFQGVPDVTILMPSGRWATLECKKSKKARHQPNQDVYVEDMREKSYSAFIYPENKEEILDELQQTFGS